MITMGEAHSKNAVYFGERRDWKVVYSVTRNSDLLEETNFEVIWEEMSERFGKDVAVERSSHWLVGWIDFILVNPENEGAVETAEEYRRRMEEYPVLDDERLEQAEWEDHVRNHLQRPMYRDDILRLERSDCSFCNELAVSLRNTLAGGSRYDLETLRASFIAARRAS